MRSGHRPCPARSWHTAAVLCCSLGLSTCRAEHQNEGEQGWKHVVAALLCCCASQQECCCPLVVTRAIPACQCTPNDTRTIAESLSTPSAGAASLPRFPATCCASGSFTSYQTRDRKSRTRPRGSRRSQLGGGTISTWSRGQWLGGSPCRVPTAVLENEECWQTWAGVWASGRFCQALCHCGSAARARWHTQCTAHSFLDTHQCLTQDHCWTV